MLTHFHDSRSVAHSMSEKPSPEDVDRIINDLNGLISDDDMAVLKNIQKQSQLDKHIADLALRELEDLKAAIAMYERECGESSIMFQDNMRICKEQVAMGRR